VKRCEGNERLCSEPATSPDQRAIADECSPGRESSSPRTLERRLPPGVVEHSPGASIHVGRLPERNRHPCYSHRLGESRHRRQVGERTVEVLDGVQPKPGRSGATIPEVATSGYRSIAGKIAICSVGHLRAQRNDPSQRPAARRGHSRSTGIGEKSVSFQARADPSAIGRQHSTDQAMDGLHDEFSIATGVRASRGAQVRTGRENAPTCPNMESTSAGRTDREERPYLGGVIGCSGSSRSGHSMPQVAQTNSPAR